MSVGDEQDHKSDFWYRLKVVLGVLTGAVILGLIIAGLIWASASVERSGDSIAVPVVQPTLSAQQREELDELRMLQMMVSANPQERAIRQAIRERRLGIAILNQNLAWTILQTETPNLEWCRRLLEDQVLMDVPEHKAEFADTMDLFERKRRTQ